MRMALLGKDGLDQKYGTFDTAIARAKEYLALAQRLQYPAVEMHARLVLAEATMTKDDTTGMEMIYDLEHRLQQFTVSRVPPGRYIQIMSSGDAPTDEEGFSEWVKGLIYQSFSIIYWMNESGRAREFNDKAMNIFRKLRADRSLSIAYLNLGLRSGNADSSIAAYDSAYFLAARKGNMEDIMADALSNKVNHLKLKNRWDEYLKVLKELDTLGARLPTPEITGWNQIKYGEYYRHKNMHDSAILHLKKALRVADEMHSLPIAYWADRYLYEIYRSIDVKDSALVYLEHMNHASAEAQRVDPLSKFWDLDFQKNVELKSELEEARAFRTRTERGVVVGAILIPLVIAVVYFRRRA